MNKVIGCKVHNEPTDNCDECWNNIYKGTEMEIIENV